MPYRVFYIAIFDIDCDPYLTYLAVCRALFVTDNPLAVTGLWFFILGRLAQIQTPRGWTR